MSPNELRGVVTDVMATAEGMAEAIRAGLADPEQARAALSAWQTCRKATIQRLDEDDPLPEPEDDTEYCAALYAAMTGA